MRVKEREKISSRVKKKRSWKRGKSRYKAERKTENIDKI